jgi:hypothetical protein
MFINKRMSANVVIIDQYMCVKKPPMKPQHIYACKILQMKELVMYLMGSFPSFSIILKSFIGF